MELRLWSALDSRPRSAWGYSVEVAATLLGMQIIYLDESYKRGRHYWLGAAAVDEDEVAGLCVGIQAAIAQIPNEFGIPPNTELHAQHLYHGDEDFVPMKQAVRARIQCYTRGLHALCDAASGLFFVGVDWNDHIVADRLAVHRLAAFDSLLPELESFLEDRGDNGLIVADEEETTAEDVVTAVSEHQHDRRSMTGRFSRLLDAPLFTPSHHSGGVQASDLGTFIKARLAFNRPDEDERARKTLEQWWRLMEPLILVDRCGSAPSMSDHPLSTKGRTKCGPSAR